MDTCEPAGLTSCIADVEAVELGVKSDEILDQIRSCKRNLEKKQFLGKTRQEDQIYLHT